MNINEMIVGGTYTLTPRSPVIYGSRIEKAKLLGVVEYSVAAMIAPIKQQYAQIFPSLPANTPYAPETSKYYIFQQLNGEKIAICEQWIVEGSIDQTDRIIYNVIVYDGKLGDADKITAALRAIGITELAVTVKE